ncbi:MAG: hypothetical protein IJR00_02530 [Lachnospiraceae bacterium]|nr:hypothetical protein [Lachnospiraceae bacterium]
MSMSIGNNYSSLFSSLNGKYNAANDMAALSAQRSQITSGSYGKLMKAYVGKVGNKAALNAYRSSGTTVNSATDLNADTSSASATSSVSSKKTVARSSFLDSHLSSIGKPKQSSTAQKEAVQESQKKYAGMQSSWLDDHLKSYNESASVQTAANTSVAIDTTA